MEKPIASWLYDSSEEMSRLQATCGSYQHIGSHLLIDEVLFLSVVVAVLKIEPRA